MKNRLKSLAPRITRIFSGLGTIFAQLAKNEHDYRYWANVFAMAGAASLAVAFIEGNVLAMYSGIGFCLYGLKLSRRG